MADEPFALIYIHGFNSSPQAYKANLLLDHLRNDGKEAYFYAPELPFNPEQAMQLLVAKVGDLIVQHGSQRVFLVGSSLGGYYAAYLAERYQVPVALINPSVEPYVTLNRYLGENTNVHTGERYTLTEEHAEVLKTYRVDHLSNPGNYLLMAQTADETLDYRKAVLKYGDCEQVVEAGGCHGFDGFNDHIPMILDFFIKRIASP